MTRCVGFFIFLLNSSLIFAQNQMPESLQQQFNNYQSGAMQEKLFVHTDKTFYLAGETVWFKIYAVDASFHKPVATSSISYIEILNKNLKPVVQSKIPMLNGNGAGSVILPGFLATGNYILRAYTNWMKNFSPDFYYEHTLHIVNTLKLSPVVPSSKLTSDIQFFPEGGSQLSGITGKIAFKAADVLGHGLECKGVILNQNNDTIVRFQSFHNGMGSFLLKPEKNSSYFALVRLNDSLIKQKLPDATDHGFAMNVSEGEFGKLNVTVHASADFNNTSVYLFAQTRQIIKNVQSGLVKEGEVSFTINKSMLGDGISSITIFNQSSLPVCERLVFKRPVEKLSIQAKTDQPAYARRKLVRIDLSTSNANSQPIAGNLSMSVFMIDSLQHIPEQSIISYLYLNSELKGRIESPEYYFSNNDKTSDEALDNLLLTQGWRRFKWSEVMDSKKPAFEFLPEVEGPVVNGKIVNKLTGTPVAFSGAFLSIPGDDYAFSSATSDAQGQVHFGFRDIYKNNAIVVQPALQKDSSNRIDIINSYSDKFSLNSLRPLTIPRSQEAILVNRSISTQVENTYAVERKRQYIKTNPDTTSFYGKPDRQYNLDDFTRFQTMEEVMREFVEDVRVRKDGEKYNFKVRNRLFNTYFEEDPLILLDGIPISDASKIIALDPLKIKRIELVLYNYYIGSSVFAGIVNVKSYSGEIGATQIDPNSLVIEYDGLQQQREFYSPQYGSGEAEESHIPDFRNVLFWAPQITTGSAGKSQLSFYSSDLKGKFAVVIQGITADGLPGKTVTQFEVTDAN
ncbi:MAG TPA: hypothetical protein VFE04_04785 [Puia sp.]|nr:hypothetical protein [Puia sp.]